MLTGKAACTAKNALELNHQVKQSVSVKVKRPYLPHPKPSVLGRVELSQLSGNSADLRSIAGTAALRFAAAATSYSYFWQCHFSKCEPRTGFASHAKTFQVKSSFFLLFKRTLLTRTSAAAAATPPFHFAHRRLLLCFSFPSLPPLSHTFPHPPQAAEPAEWKYNK